MIDYLRLIHLKFSDRASFLWDDNNMSATVTFVADDATAIALAMSVATLTALRADIDAELARKTQPTQHR